MHACRSTLEDPTGFTHGHAVAAVALGNATVVPLDYGPGWQKADRRGIVRPLDGVAPRAVLVAYDAAVTPLSGKCGDPQNSALNVGSLYTGEGTVGSLETAYHTHAARTFDLSWGTTNNPVYFTNASAIDGFLANAAHPAALLVVAAGNDGNDTDADGVPDPGSIADPATAKNAIVVGGSGNTSEPFNGLNEQDRYFNSSVGPATAASQRVAPILMAPGTDFFNGDGVGSLPGSFSPGTNMGFDSEFLCRSSDNDQAVAVECDVYQGLSGTSYAAGAASGAAMLVRDYFAQGFYPDGTSSNLGNASDVVTALSGVAVKSILVASADWMDRSTPEAASNEPGDNLSRRYRFNNEQGYGRIQLDNALPLQSHVPSPPGLILADGAIAGGRLDVPGLTGDLNTGAAETDIGTFTVCDDSRELRVALVWMDSTGEVLNRNLDLELRAPSGKVYYGNYFTDDNNKNGQVDAGEDCPNGHLTGSSTNLDESPWSLLTCANSAHDNRNPTEAIFLSPDARLDGTAANADKQTELGIWNVHVRTGAGSAAAVQPYALAVVGGVCLGSAVRLDPPSFDCDDQLRVVVDEKDEGVDPAVGLIDAEVASRTSVEVIDAGPDRVLGTGDDLTVDLEDSSSGLSFTHTGLHFVSGALAVTASALASAHDGLVEVRDGQTIRALYRDESSGSPDPNKLRAARSPVRCRADLIVGGVVFAQLGMDAAQIVEGGCERDARGLFTFGHPDRYMDSGERVVYRVAFQSLASQDLEDVEASLRCVLVDANSPEDCAPGTTGCPDPNRVDNPPCPFLTVLDSPKPLGDLPGGQVATAAFTIEVGAIAGTPDVEMIVGVSSPVSGSPAAALLVNRVTLNADELSYYYSTDFLTGGTEIRDWPSLYQGSAPSNEVVDDPTSSVGDPLQDYRFDTMTWSSLQATGRNGSLTGPWNFDTTNNGFRVGLNNTTTPNLTETIANWGEDRNFNGVLDYHCSASVTTLCPGRCDGAVPCTPRVCGRCQFSTTTICTDPVDCIPSGGGACQSAVGTLGTCLSDEDRDGPGGSRNGLLDDNWSTAGGCGWQTNGTTNNPSLPGGVWHTGRIDNTGFPAAQCLVPGANPGACQSYEILTGTASIKREWEMLLSPRLDKVNQCTTDAGPLPATCGGQLDGTRKVFTVEFTNWAWNMAMDLKDHFAQIRYELDTDDDSSSAIDLYNDAIVLLALGGNQGPVSNGNAPLTDGFPVFAPFAGASSQNGTLGKNRVGRNPCYFEVNPQIPPFHLADPPDDDVDDDSDGPIDEFVAPNGPIRNFDLTSNNGPDMRFTTLEDIYGPSGDHFRASLGFRVFEGDPDYGAAQSSFGVSVDDMVVQWREFKLVEDAASCATSGACATVEADSSRVYGGDGVLEITVHDASPYRCTGGPACTPEGKNDCDHDGSFAGIADDADCDDDGTADVLVKAISIPEPAGEWVVLDRIAGTNAYRGTLPLATSLDAAGILQVADQGGQSADITLRYEDAWDGTSSGSPCGNHVNPALRGVVESGVDLLVETGFLTVRSYRVDDRNGDLDGYPDTGETIDLYLTVSNKTGRDVTNLTLGISTNDPKIDCLLRTESVLGFLAAGGAAEPPVPFSFRVSAQADRAGTTPPASCLAGTCTNGAGACTIAAQCARTVDEDYFAKFTVTFGADQFDVNSIPQEVVLDLDLNSILTAGPTSTYVEGFETGFANMTFMNLDFNRASNSASNGFRCQYNDPDYPGSNSYGDTECYLGFPGQTPVNDWHVHASNSPDAGRSYAGNNSLHYGVHTAGNPGLDTYKLSQLDAIRNRNAIPLAGKVCQNDPSPNKRGCNSAADCVVVGGGPCVSASPELSFKHQISTTDSRCTGTPFGQAADRAMLAAKTATGTVWQKIFPYQNVYDVQGTDNFSNCTFDPVDDGNDEDDYFDPTDPNRRLGPSSTCFPEFVFSYLGDTDAPFNATEIGRASDGPGLKGNIGQGTWVESKFDMSRYRGRAVLFRFLFTTIKVSDRTTLEEIFMWNPTPCDDGWYVDDVRMTFATSSTTVTTDAADNSGLPGCGASCGALSASLGASPASLPRPGVVQLTASATADRCVDGALLFQFWEDGDGNGTPGDPGDTLLRDYGVSPFLDDAPLRTTSYLVRVKCTSATGPPCTGVVASTSVPVSCPGGAFVEVYDPAAWWANLTFTSATTLAVPATPGVSRRLDVARGSLGLLRETGVLGGETCIAGESYATSFVDSATPPAGQGYYYLIRDADSVCNDNSSWSTYHPKESDDPSAGRARDRQVSGCSP